MYNHSSILIVTLLFVALVIGAELGYQIGRRFISGTDEPKKTQITAIQGSVLGVLALLLGFTFSLSLQRYDTRSASVVAEANAIGTAMLRAGLIDPRYSDRAQTLVRDYLDLRLRAVSISLDRVAERDAVLAQSDRVLQSLWAIAARLAAEDANPVRSGLFVQALNEVIDEFGNRDAALERHVPEPVLFLLFATLVLTAGLVGYSSGVTGHRVTLAAYILLVLIVLLVFMVIDLDRPRRGLIEVSQQPLVELRSHILFDAAAPDSAAALPRAPES